jgi:hypothetical protein
VTFHRGQAHAGRGDEADDGAHLVQHEEPNHRNGVDGEYPTDDRRREILRAAEQRDGAKISVSYWQTRTCSMT